MSRPAPILRSASWADVEDEEQEKLKELKKDQPVQDHVEARPAPISQPVRKIEPRTESNRSGGGKQGKAANNGKQNGRQDERNFWESSLAKGKALPKDGQETWRRGEALPPVQNGRKENGEKPKAKKKSGSRSRGSKSEKSAFEVCIRPVPSTLTKEEVQKAFDGETVLKFKLLKDIAYVHFGTKEAQENALKKSLPRWGDLQPRASIPPPKEKTEKESKKQLEKKTANSSSQDQFTEFKKVTAGSSSTAQAVQIKKGKPEEKKVSNIFAALDSEEEEEDESGDDSEQVESDGDDSDATDEENGE